MELKIEISRLGSVLSLVDALSNWSPHVPKHLSSWYMKQYKALSDTDREIIKDYSDLFYEPFYQMMRLQFLAWRMEQENELGADMGSVLYILPRANNDIDRVTSPNLRPLGYTVFEIWGNLAKDRSKFHHISTEELFGKFEISRHPDLLNWWDYIAKRYEWL